MDEKELAEIEESLKDKPAVRMGVPAYLVRRLLKEIRRLQKELAKR